MLMMTHCPHRDEDSTLRTCSECALEGQISAVRACMEEVLRYNDGAVSFRVRAIMNATEHLCKLTEEV